METSSKKNVAYFYDWEVGKYLLGPSHPMKPYRLTLTHSLVGSFDLYKKMKVYRSGLASEHDMYLFHSKQYVDFLKMVRPETKNDYMPQLSQFKLELDCPVFDGLWDYCARYTGASLQAAHLLNKKEHDIVINWSGGLHHARRESASGFCYINDIVLSIISLLDHHERVLYIDIDVHHGDAVQDAFYRTDRVMTLSFHKHGEGFFPLTGDFDEVGAKAGRYYSINVPMKSGCTDEMYQHIFDPVVKNVIDFYRPNVIVLQCGADSLADDRLGCFNLSVHGHGRCVKYVKAFNIPMLVLGGGGYTARNVARCWTYETSVCLDEAIPNKIPLDYRYIENFGPQYNLNYVPYSAKENNNTYKNLDVMEKLILELLKTMPHAPSVQMREIHDPIFNDDEEEEDNADPDIRDSDTQREKRVDHDAEFYDNEDDDDPEAVDPMCSSLWRCRTQTHTHEKDRSNRKDPSKKRNGIHNTDSSSNCSNPISPSDGSEGRNNSPSEDIELNQFESSHHSPLPPMSEQSDDSNHASKSNDTEDEAHTGNPTNKDGSSINNFNAYRDSTRNRNSNDPSDEASHSGEESDNTDNLDHGVKRKNRKNIKKLQSKRFKLHQKLQAALAERGESNSPYLPSSDEASGDEEQNELCQHGDITNSEDVNAIELYVSSSGEDDDASDSEDELSCGLEMSSEDELGDEEEMLNEDELGNEMEDAEKRPEKKQDFGAFFDREDMGNNEHSEERVHRNGLND